MNKKILSLCNWPAEETIKSHRKYFEPFIWLSGPEKSDLVYTLSHQSTSTHLEIGTSRRKGGIEGTMRGACKEELQ